MSVNSYFKSEGLIANTLHESAKAFSKQHLRSRNCRFIKLIANNLDSSISFSEWKRILTLNFKSIAKNSFYIRITRQSDARFCAIASISTLEDAQLLISHLNRRRIGNRRIYFNFLTSVDQNYPHKQNVSNRIQSKIEETVFRPPVNIVPKGTQNKCGDNTDSSPAHIQSENTLKIKNPIHFELLSNDQRENVQEFNQENLPSVHITLAELHSNVLK
ncbi:unnamed protein product, partial [Hymenolepis diminuta]